uniref:Uncharacterized protein n=2 Tax=Meloidogyne TaxID=189290 RepID=A0A6V7VIZ7_MELEN|nr:unnamed protein product [Meloidogyne enterolobii]
MNYCSLPEICLNGGNCLNNSVDNKYFCECLNNGSGINCENSKENLFIDGDNSMDILENPCKQKPDYCNNAGECHLLPNTTHRYCKCLPPFTGIYCETKKLPNFNLYFAGIKAKINSPINQKINSQLFPCKETLEKFTFCLWVKFGEIDKNFINNYFENERKRKTFFTFAMVNGNNYTSLLELDEFNLNIFTSKNSQLNITYGNKENFENNIWNHICIASNGDNSNNYLSLYLNGNLIKNLIFSWKWPELINNECRIFIGENGNEENNYFIGQISKAELYSESFNSKQINYFLNNCLNNNYFSIEPLIAWNDFSSVIVYNSAIIVIHPGICLNNYCKFGENNCFNENKNSRSTKISIKCPESQQIILDNPNQRLINVNWDDSFNKLFPFSIQNPIVRLESNFRPGQIFTWGYHRIIYYVEDSFGYWNSCEFNIIISPNKCQLPSNNSKNNNSTILILNKMDLKENSEAEFNAKLFCKNNEYILKKQQPFYICARLGKWNHWENIGIPFEFPSCSSTENVLQEIEGNLNFNGFCSNYNEYQDEITRSILNISKKLGGFCEKQNCDGQLFIRSACSFENEEKSVIWMEGNFNRKQKRLIKREENKKIIKIKFYLNLRNLKYSVGPIILNYLKSLFGNNFNEEQTRLSCSDNFPQLDIENKPNINISDPNSLPIIQCSTCAPGETWKDTEQKYTTITTKNSKLYPLSRWKNNWGVSGCIYLSDCFKNCSPGYIYSWENDKCIPCPRGQFMPYSGRLKCLACPIDSTTVGEGSINKEGCSIKCKDGEEMGQNEQCKPCMKGTFREGLMSVCKRCQIGFTTKKEGSLNSKECNQINCPPGYFANNKLINEEINLNFKFLQICLPCPIGYYENEFGSNKCKKCPEGYITKQLGAKNIFECDQVWDGSCKPDQPEPCPNGSECIQIRGKYLNNIREQRIKRFWFPIILGIICVIIIGILFLFFILNRKKCLLFFHQYFYFCGKITLDNLNNNNFTRNDLPIFTTTQPLQNLINQSFNQQKQPNKNIKRRAISDSDLLKRHVNHNLINDPINQIKNNLMEEFENKENNNIEIKIPPKLTVQTSFKEIENNKFRQRIYSCSSSSSSSSSNNYGIIEENENNYQNEKTENTNGRLCVFTMDEEIENQKYQIKRDDSSSEKSKDFPSSELVTQINLTNVELRRIQLEKQLKITPFQSGLRSSLTARNINRLPPPNNNLKKKHPPTNTPSYDDDDDAFFS